MQPTKLAIGDTIGVICPCHYADKVSYAECIAGLQTMGFVVKQGTNLYKMTYGYAASEQERADDFHQMLLDDTVKMILFGGGHVGNELLSLLAYDAIKQHPKIICSYSNGTSILNAIYAQTKLTVYYGQFPGVYKKLHHYDFMQFKSNFIDAQLVTFMKNSTWVTHRGGTCEGILLGGFSTTVALMLGNTYFTYEKEQSYILFLENKEAFHCAAEVQTHLSYIEQNAFINQVTGLLFGHFSDNHSAVLTEILERFGRKHNIPVVSCDDFGHGNNHAIVPIGQLAVLDADAQTLRFL